MSTEEKVFPENCLKCGKKLANTIYGEGVCPICALGSEGSQSKYWETSKAKKAGGFRYSDDTAVYSEVWDKTKKVWVKK